MSLLLQLVSSNPLELTNFLVLISTLIAVYVTNFYWKVSKYPKGPIPLPLLGNILRE